MFRRTLLSVLMALFPLSQALATEPLTVAVENQLEQVRRMAADFRQVKSSADQSLSLKSEGKLLVARNQGVLWQQTKPFEQSIRISDTTMTMQVEDDPVEVIKADSGSVIFSFVSVLKGVFEGNFKQLTDYFNVEADGSVTDSWKIRLIPKVSPFDQAFKAIVLEGKNSVDTIQLSEKNGDLTKIELFNKRLNKDVSESEMSVLKQR